MPDHAKGHVHWRECSTTIAGVTVTGKPGVAEGSKGGRVTGKAVVAEATGGATGQSAVARTEAPGHGGSECPRYQTKRKPIID